MLKQLFISISLYAANLYESLARVLKFMWGELWEKIETIVFLYGAVGLETHRKQV